MRIPAPVFNIVSDRRGEFLLDVLPWRHNDSKNSGTGGRTAWSATVTVQGQNLAARYWYDGQYLNNAKEDAAEVACTKLRNPSISSSQATSYRSSSSSYPSGAYR